MLKTTSKLLRTLLALLGVLFLAAPFLLYRFIHEDYERHMWLIKGPAPIDSIDSGPVQLWTSLLLAFIGVMLLASALLLNTSAANTPRTRSRRANTFSLWLSIFSLLVCLFNFSGMDDKNLLLFFTNPLLLLLNPVVTRLLDTMNSEALQLLLLYITHLAFWLCLGLLIDLLRRRARHARR
ncbi:hypothetical protein [Paenibacillus donghaensis]|uniref:Uncharacterized protein n=1 Tax=Paenibacillus donghaensis TaxID=414771 RepID=A0A2Z2KLU4_9BACL|nr:hypothetical protein [Paenibacillus donghaensis]ASA25315.1 hypothetical protein B9T62_34040 [Paenibacillus donghaensis]